jgi:hypothetical protein
MMARGFFGCVLETLLCYEGVYVGSDGLVITMVEQPWWTVC